MLANDFRFLRDGECFFSGLKRTDNGRGGSSEKRGKGDTSAQSERTKANETHHSHSHSHAHSHSYSCARSRDTHLPLLFCSPLHTSCSCFVFVSSHTFSLNTLPTTENEENIDPHAHFIKRTQAKSPLCLKCCVSTLSFLFIPRSHVPAPHPPHSSFLLIQRKEEKRD